MRPDLYYTPRRIDPPTEERPREIGGRREKAQQFTLGPILLGILAEVNRGDKLEKELKALKTRRIDDTNV